jgi:hypothetical protein
MNIAKRTISDLNTLIEQGAFLSQDQLSKFDSHYKSLSSMEKQFFEHRSDAEDIINVTKRTLN